MSVSVNKKQKNNNFLGLFSNEVSAELWFENAN